MHNPRYIYATFNNAYIFINCAGITSIYPHGNGCVIKLLDGSDIKVKETQNIIIHRIFGVSPPKQSNIGN